MLNKLPMLALSAFMLYSCNSPESNTPATLETSTDSAAVQLDSGFVSLFDGTSTTGWHSYGKSTVDEVWQVTDGAIVLDTTKLKNVPSTIGRDLVTNDEYDNFHLKLQWKIAPGGNSGIIFYVHEDTTKYKAVYLTGLEMQVLDNDGHSDGKIKKHRAGDLYDLIACSKETVKPVGEWNDVEIISKDGKLDLILNGTTVVTTTLWDDNWKKMVAGSKFKTMPDFGTYKKGHIALQEHGNMVSFKNIQIKKI
jgi:hypothetical protein